jgi:TPR repeat protein
VTGPVSDLTKGARLVLRPLCCVLALTLAALMLPQAAFAKADAEQAAALLLYNAGNHAKARPAFEAACKAGNGLACFSAGFMWSKGEGGKADDKKARGFYESGCKLGDGGACNNLANFQNSGRGGPADPVAAVATYERACAANNQLGCFQAAKYLKYGDASGKVKIDGPRAHVYYVKACELGMGAACFIAGSNALNGFDTPVDVVRGRALLSRGCALGDKEACERNLR